MRVNSKLVVMTCLTALAATGAAARPSFSDGNFEAVTVGGGNYAYYNGPVGPWNFAGAALVDSTMSSAWYVAPPKGGSGNQFVALQSVAAFSQQFVATSTTMDLTWLHAGREHSGTVGGNEAYTVTLNDSVVGRYRTSAGVGFTAQGAHLVALTPGQEYTLGFEGVVATTDETAFIDRVAVVRTAGGNLLTNSGFENGPLDPEQYRYWNGTNSGWTYLRSAQVNATGASAWYGAKPVGFMGDQFAALQGLGSISQTFTTTGASHAHLTWLAGGRSAFPGLGGDQDYAVMLDGVQVGGARHSASDQSFALNKMKLGPLVAGRHTLMFQGLSPRDETTFLDNVSIAAVPEPATWTMLLLGTGLVGAAGRVARARRRAAA